MGRPIQKKWFGLGESKIRLVGVCFADGTTASNAVILRQTGTRSYLVSDDTGTRAGEIVTLADVTSVEQLKPGQGFIAVNASGQLLPVTKIQQYRLAVEMPNGQVGSFAWVSEPGTAGPGQVDLIGDINNAVIPAVPEMFAAPAPQPVLEKIYAPSPLAIKDLTGAHLKPDGTMFVGLGNIGDKYAMSTNVKNGIEVGLKIHRRASASQGAVTVGDGVIEYSVPADGFSGSGTSRRVSWAATFTCLALGEAKLTDFEIEMAISIKQDEAPIILTRKDNGSWMFGEILVMTVDGNLVSHGGDVKLIDQNSMNIGYPLLDPIRGEFDPTVGGVYQVELRAKKQGKIVAKSSAVVTTGAEGATWTPAT